mgnify:FL=1
MSYYKIVFFSLTAEKIQDTKYFINVFSRTNGKLKLIANGLGKPKSRFTKLQLPFILAKGMIYNSREQSGFILTDIDIINTFEYLRSDFVSLNSLSYFAIFLNYVLAERLKNTAFFDKTLEFIKNNAILNLKTILSYEMLTLDELGYLPKLETCQNCKSAVPDGFYMFNFDTEILCKNCAEIIKKNNVEQTKKKTNYFDGEFIQFYKELQAKKNLKNCCELDIEKLNNILLKKLENYLNNFIINIHKKCYDDYITLKKIIRAYKNND